jgi:hypothetical protein
MIMITGRYSPLQAVETLNLSSRLFGMRVSLRGKRSAWASLAWSANGLAFTSANGLKAGEGCEERDANVGVLSHRNQGGFKAISGTILPNGGQSYTVYTPLGNDDRNASPRTTKYRCWSLREGLDSRK